MTDAQRLAIAETMRLSAHMELDFVEAHITATTEQEVQAGLSMNYGRGPDALEDGMLTCWTIWTGEGLGQTHEFVSIFGTDGRALSTWEVQ